MYQIARRSPRPPPPVPRVPVSDPNRFTRDSMPIQPAAVLVSVCASLLLAGSPLDAQVSRPIDRGIRHFESREFAEAKRVLLPLAEQNPRDARAAFYVGQVYRHEGNADRAVEWLERAVRIEPGSAEYHLHLAGALGDKAQRSNVARQAIYARRIRSHLEEALRLDPQNLEARFGMVQFYAVAPGMVGGNKQRARQEAEQLRRHSPYRGALAMGFIYEAERNHAAAEVEFRAAVTQFPDSATLYYRLANANANLERYDSAFEALETLLRRRPGEVSALYRIGRLAAISGERLDRGEQALREYLRRPAPGGPPAASAHWRLASIHERRGDTTQARSHLQASLHLDPSHREVRAALRRLGG
jgi:tetratricopeptide (TPR) repeat protein